MKNLTKIFMAVVALFAVSCTTDMTGDLAPELGLGEGQTSLTLSLEGSRTQLGEKGLDGVYPVTWCEDDVVAINGTASTGIEIKEEGKAATFTFGGNGVQRPFHVVYPAPAANVEASATEGLYPVTFLAEQAYTEGTFCDGAAVMCGYGAEAAEGEEAAPIQMRHLTGVLRVAPYGEGVTLTSLTVKSESGKIAGTFDVNCQTGELTPRADATNTLTVTFGTGLALAASAETALPIYIAVPAGDYGKFTLVLHTADNSMTIGFDSTGDKKIKPAVVREFGAFPYNANEVEDGEFLIETKEDLMKFAQIAGNFYPYTTAKLGAIIDMTGEDWTPIEGFGPYTFNGDKQSGYYIKGLNAPLFGTTSATIKDLELRDVNIASNGRLVLGAVACTFEAAEGNSISNCKVSGTITVSNPDAVIAADADLYKTFVCGGVVGLANSDVTGCVNEANITVNQVAKSDNTVALHPSVGGVVGYSVAGSVTNCVNGSETVETVGAVKYLDTHATKLYIPHIAGIVALRASGNTASDLKGNTNYGAIEFNANAGGGFSLDYTSTSVGGIFGYSTGAIENNNNYGTVDVKGGKLVNILLGGIGGNAAGSSFYNNHNNQGANITVGEAVTFHSLNVAGVLSARSGGTGTIDTCTNDAPISVSASSAADIPTNAAAYYRVAGILTYTGSTGNITNCENKANGDITVRGNVVLARSDKQACYGVSGVFTYFAKASGQSKNLTNRGDINVYTNTSLHTAEGFATNATYGKITIAGISGYVTGTQTNLHNYGNITIGDGTNALSIVANGIYIAGVAPFKNKALTTATNNGTITINNKVSFANGLDATADAANIAANTFVGGVVGYGTNPSTGITNNSNITINATTADITYYGGLTGYVGAIYTATNNGSLTVNGSIGNIAYIGGVAGHAVSETASTALSNGGIVNINATCSNILYAGGVTGYYTAAEFTGVAGTTTNSGALTIGENATVASIAYVGGVHGYTAASLTTVSNSGNVTINGECKDYLYLAGNVGYNAGSAMTDCSNSGDLTINKHSTHSKFVYFGGFAGYTLEATTLTNCHNTGVLTMAETVTGVFESYTGGLVGYPNANITLDNCTNSLKEGVKYGIVINNKQGAGQANSNRERIGGLIGHANQTLTVATSVSNSAGIMVKAHYVESGGLSIGGIAGVIDASNLTGTITNSGDIYYEGRCTSCNFGVGGIFATPAGSITEATLTNTGDIYIVKGAGITDHVPVTKTDKRAVVGGIVGFSCTALKNARFFGDFYVVDWLPGKHESGNTYGMIVGTNIATTHTDCHCGGKIFTGVDEETEEDIFIDIKANNYYEYMVGGVALTAEEAIAAGCGYISSINATPVDPNGNAISAPSAE